MKVMTAANSVMPNVRLKNFSSVEKSEKVATNVYKLVNFNQISQLFTNVRYEDCEKQCSNLDLVFKLVFSYNLKLTCISYEEDKTDINSSRKAGNAVYDLNLLISQAFYIMIKVMRAQKEFVG